MSQSYVFYINGITCGDCASVIKSYLINDYPAIIDCVVHDVTAPDPKKVTITISDNAEELSAEQYETTWSQLSGLIDDCGYNCEPYEMLPNEEQYQISTKQNKQKSALKKIINSHWFLGILGFSSGIITLIASMGFGMLPLAAMLPLALSSVLLTLILGAQSYKAAWNKLIHSLPLTMDSLFALSTIITMAISLSSFFIPSLPMMFDVSLLIYGFRHIGIAIENSLKEKISSAKFKDKATKMVRMENQNEKIHAYRLKAKDIILMYPGETVPVDGLCLESSYVYDITFGSSLPRRINRGEPIIAGMTVAPNAPPLKIQVEKQAKDSRLDELDRYIEQLLSKKRSPIPANEEKTIEGRMAQILAYFIPSILSLAAISGGIISIFFPFSTAIQCTVSVLVSACPCTLGLIIPLAIKAAIHKAITHGIRFKNAKSLQKAEHIDAVFFDLNGTLTIGSPQVKTCRPLAGYSVDQLLSYCRLLEKESKHPIGKAIYSYANRNNQENTKIIMDAHQHSGASGTIDGVHYLIGSASLMKKNGINAPLAVKHYPSLEVGESMVFIAREKEFIGYLIISDPLREDAPHIIKKLQSLNKKIYICTGADKETVLRYTQNLTIDPENIYSNCPPTLMKDHISKPEHILALKDQGQKVGMAGDAENDATAMAACDFGIAVLSQDSHELTQMHAEAVVKKNSLMPIANIFLVANQTADNIHQNLFISFAYNFFSVLLSSGLLLSVGFSMPPVFGVIFMISQACIIFLNVYRFKNMPLDESQETLETEQPISPDSPRLMTKHMSPAIKSELRIENTMPPYTPPKSSSSSSICVFEPTTGSLSLIR